MNMRATSSIVTFSFAFTLSEYQDELPAGEYEIVVEEEFLQGLSSAAYRRTATHLMVYGRGRAGRTEARPVTEKDLEAALARDRGLARDIKDSGAALFPLEDMQ